VGYLGNNLQAAYSSYLLIDSLTASFNGTTTSFPLRVNGITPVPFPVNEQNVLISVGGVPQKPDPTGAEGFRFSGSNIVFSSAPKTGEAFWGVVLAGADYINVGADFPDGSASAPSITFASEKSTGFYKVTSGTIGVTLNGSLGPLFTGSGVYLNNTNNGLYSPGTNQLALSTAGTGRLFINSSGNVGIGTASPVGKFEVSTGNAEGLRLSSASYLAPSEGPWIAFNGGPFAGWDTARIQGIRLGANAEGGLVFYTNTGGSGAGTIAEKARIDNSGRLLVGTSTSGTSLLQVNAQASASGNAFRSVHRIADTGSGLTQTNTAAPYISYLAGLSAASNATAIAIVGEDFAAGNAGLQLEFNYVKSTGAVASGDRLGRISFGGDDATNVIPAAQIAAFVDGTPGTNDMPGCLVFSTTADGAATPTERMRIDNSGRVLVGTSSAVSNVARFGTDFTPGAQFVTNTASWNTGLGLINYATGGFAPALTFGLSSSSAIGTNTLVSSGNRLGVISFNGNDGTNFEEAARIEAFVDGTPGANDMPGRLVFSTTADGAATPTERVRITSSGNVGIGTTSPVCALNIVGGAINSGGGTGLGISSNLAAGTFATGPAVASINSSTDASSVEIVAGSTGGNSGIAVSGSGGGVPSTVRFYANSNERARITSTGELLIGTTTTTANGGKLQVSNGITFPATQVACTDVNTLDDYEEGTWTPTVVGSSTAGTATYVVRAARYTKIGRLVQFELYLEWNSGTGTGELRITGLPFTPASSNTYPACAIGFASNVTLTASNVPTAAVIDSPAAIWIRQTPVGGGTATNVAYDAAGTLLISGTYSV
jgi:hypothetical protein